MENLNPVEPTDRSFKGVWIPKELYLDQELSWTEKILLIEIDSLDNNEEKGCYASNKHLAKFLQKSESTVANLICKLKKMGWLDEVYNDGRTRGLRLTNGKSGLPKTVNQGYRKRYYSNTEERREEEESSFTKDIKEDSVSSIKFREKEQSAAVFEYWQNTLGHQNRKLTPDRDRKIKARLREGYTTEQLKSAIDGCAASEFHMGKNDSGVRYDEIDLIFRNSTQTDSFIARRGAETGLAQEKAEKKKAHEEYLAANLKHAQEKNAFFAQFGPNGTLAKARKEEEENGAH